MINETLFKAVETGNADEVEKALTKEKINASTYYGAKSIIFAARQENSKILEMILKNGEKINRESFWRRAAQSALSYAIQAENTETLRLLLEYGAGKKSKISDYLPLLHDFRTGNKEMNSETNRTGNKEINSETNITKTKFCYEDGVFLPEESSKDNRFIQYAREGKIKKMKDLLEKGISETAILSAVDAALEKDRWEVAAFLSAYSENRDIETYSESLKMMFLKSAQTGDTEKIKCYLEKLIENIVGVLTDESGKTTLEIALENNFEDIIRILTNYGFHANALRHAFRYLKKYK